MSDPTSTPDAPAPDLTLRDKLTEYLSGELGDTYDCTRVWDAWSYNTMTDEDFDPVVNRLDSIVLDLMTIIERHAAALRAERDEPRGCPTPGACSCPGAERDEAQPVADRVEAVAAELRNHLGFHDQDGPAAWLHARNLAPKIVAIATVAHPPATSPGADDLVEVDCNCLYPGSLGGDCDGSCVQTGIPGRVLQKATSPGAAGDADGRVASILETVENQVSERETGCLSMADERLLADAYRLIVRGNRPHAPGEPRLSHCGYCKSWHSKPCGEGCHWEAKGYAKPAPAAAEGDRVRALETRFINLALGYVEDGRWCDDRSDWEHWAEFLTVGEELDALRSDRP